MFVCRRKCVTGIGQNRALTFRQSGCTFHNEGFCAVAANFWTPPQAFPTKYSVHFGTCPKKKDTQVCQAFGLLHINLQDRR